MATVVADGFGLVPPWVLVGTGLGVVASVAVALVFYVGGRLAPPSDPDPGETTSADARRRGEIREYLTAIDERFHEDHPFGDVTVPFYLPERGVAVTFDAHDYFRLEGEGVFTVLCEHEMPGRGLGRRLPFDVTEPDREPAPDRSAGTDGVAAAFSELGLPTDADADEVKSAYRDRVKETHPDRGGDEAAFRRVQKAYATASEHAEGETGRPDRAARSGRPGRSEPADPSSGFRR